MKLFRTLRIATYLLALLVASPSPSLAFDKPLPNFAIVEKQTPFTDLPGVKPPEENAKKDEVVCTRSYEEIEPRRWGQFKQPVYNCTQNGLTYSSRHAPSSKERDLRGIGW
jgi:hypothetical protein